MIIVKTKAEVSLLVQKYRAEGLKTGFVPTMGALHAGHLSLIAQARQQSDVVVCSIFVNPTQFNDPDDLLHYPRPLEEDTRKLSEAGCNVLFIPEVSEMYGDEEVWNHSFGQLEHIFEGKSRPGHFRGVSQIVKKLFDAVTPDVAFFGQKDYQQFLVIRKLVQDFHMPVRLEACPIMREENGLAMSSRNIRLSPSDRLNAGAISQVLYFIKDSWERLGITAVLKEGEARLKAIPNSELEYLAIADGDDLSVITESGNSPNNKVVVVVAVKIGNIRLIDNMVLRG